MATGMWTAVSGAAAQATNVDVIANNLANSDTSGFKKDVPTFKEYLGVHESPVTAPGVARAPIKDKDFYPTEGRDMSHVIVDSTHTSFKAGSLRVTQNPLDLAMDGPGFLEVSTPNGTRFTRAGSLKMALDGRLVTTEGYPVLAQNTDPKPAQTPQEQEAKIAARFINLREVKGQLSINPQGEIYADGQSIAKLGVTEFLDTNKLTKRGGMLFENRDLSNLKAPDRTVVRQGVIETSNVNPVEEMTNLIKANRMFETNMKSIRTYGDLMGKEANEVGKL